MGRHSKAEPPARVPRSGPLGSGYHRAVGANRPRGIAKWPIACLVAAAVLGVAWVGWVWASNVLNSRAEAQAGACTDGDASLFVVAAPAIAEPITDAARKWNASDRVVHDRCVTVEVAKADSQAVLETLSRKSSGSGSAEAVPAAWVPESAKWVEELAQAQPHRISGETVSIANAESADYPFVSITGDGVDAVQERASQVFRRYLLEQAQRGLFSDAGFSH